MSLSGKTALVSGGNRGIGRAIVERLAREGSKVLFLGRNERENRQVEAEINRLYPDAVRGFAVDVADEAAVNDWFAAVAEQYDSLDILVNNAGICQLSKSFTEVSDADWAATLGVNLYGVIHLTRQIIPWLKKQKSGKIVHVASLAAEVGGIATAADYVGSKAAVIGLTKSLARELAPYQINVNAVAPGFVRTQMTEAMAVDESIIPLGRMAEPEDIASAVYFLVSEESRCITGTTLDINGGLFMK
ncbi:MAG: glucose 1-dehydrogenase [Selenomonas ruminantium]|jgi:3-oxoacyl-[acyl-carrier protein] reductase|nr:glucose 1-dehydrogenase [Selenomonas ruminantium]